jgi:HemK-like putative methylase
MLQNENIMENKEMKWLLEEKYAGVKGEAFYADCKNLVLGEPLAYLIGFTSFLHCKIWLDGRPLIPRPETEFWVEEAIKVIKQGSTLSLGIQDIAPRILDICSGSGCIGTAVANAIPHALVDFGEIDVNLLPTILKNLAENNIDKTRSTVVQTNLFSTLPSRYDYILSNPPYIDESLDRTEMLVKKHEPYVALFGGEGGMEIITKLIADAPAHLAPAGQLWIEHEPEQSEAIKEIGEAYNFATSVHIDQFGVERYSILVLQ